MLKESPAKKIKAEMVDGAADAYNIRKESVTCNVSCSAYIKVDAFTMPQEV